MSAHDDFCGCGGWDCTACHGPDAVPGSAKNAHEHGCPPFSRAGTGDGNDELRLREIGARADAATPGPWEYYRDTGSYVYSRGAPTKIANLSDPWCANHNAIADADFIAHARQDVLWLLEQLAAATASEHDADCPVTHGASVDCAPPGECARRRQAVAELRDRSARFAQTLRGVRSCSTPAESGNGRFLFATHRDIEDLEQLATLLERIGGDRA